MMTATAINKEINAFRDRLERQWAHLVDAAPCRNTRILEDAFVLAWRHRGAFEVLCTRAAEAKTAVPLYAEWFAERMRQARRLHGEGQGVHRNEDEAALLRALRGVL